MVSKNNVQERLMTEAQRRPHYGLRKLSVGVASVLLGTTLYFGQADSVHADIVNSNNGGQANEDTKANVNTHEVNVENNVNTSNTSASVSNRDQVVSQSVDNSDKQLASGVGDASQAVTSQAVVAAPSQDQINNSESVASQMVNQIPTNSAVSTTSQSIINPASKAVSDVSSDLSFDLNSTTQSVVVESAAKSDHVDSSINTPKNESASVTDTVSDLNVEDAVSLSKDNAKLISNSINFANFATVLAASTADNNTVTNHDVKIDVKYVINGTNTSIMPDTHYTFHFTKNGSDPWTYANVDSTGTAVSKSATVSSNVDTADNNRFRAFMGYPDSATFNGKNYHPVYNGTNYTFGIPKDITKLSDDSYVVTANYIEDHALTFRLVDDGTGKEISNLTMKNLEAYGHGSGVVSFPMFNISGLGYYRPVSVEGLPSGMSLTAKNGLSLTSDAFKNANLSVDDNASELASLKYSLANGSATDPTSYDGKTVTIHLASFVRHNTNTTTFKIHFKYADESSPKPDKQYYVVDQAYAGQNYHDDVVVTDVISYDSTYDFNTDSTKFTHFKIDSSSSDSTVASGSLQFAESDGIRTLGPSLSGFMFVPSGSKFDPSHHKVAAMKLSLSNGTSSLATDYDKYNSINDYSVALVGTDKNNKQVTLSGDTSSIDNTTMLSGRGVDEPWPDMSVDFTLYAYKVPVIVNLQPIKWENGKRVKIGPVKSLGVNYYDTLPTKYDISQVNPNSKLYKLVDPSNVNMGFKVSSTNGNMSIYQTIPNDNGAGWEPWTTTSDGISTITLDVAFTDSTVSTTINYYDDTLGKVVSTKTLTGNPGSSFNYSTGDEIKSLKDQNYILVSDPTLGKNLTAQDTNQTYVVHFKHATKAVSDSVTKHLTVHYVKASDLSTKMADDKQANPVTFIRSGVIDLVTGKTTWTAWTPNSADFDLVMSPVINGWTPSSLAVEIDDITPISLNQDVTVTYTPDVQKAHVYYIDDTTHATLKTDDLTGVTDGNSDYSATSSITGYENKGYVLVSNNYPSSGLTFDNDDKTDQNFYVHLKHGTTTKNINSVVHRTIQYVYSNGQSAKPSVSDSLSYNGIQTIDKVTNSVTNTNWDSPKDFVTITSPKIEGYTADHDSIANTGIGHDHADINEVVTYTPDGQKAVVKYIDDTTGNQLSAEDLTGKSDQDSGYNTKSKIQQYQGLHYVLVSDSTNGNDIVYDHDNSADQAYEVHFKHGTHTINGSVTKNEVVHYVYADNQARSGKAHDDYNAESLTFTRDGYHDDVDNTDHWNAWNPASQQFKSVPSPVIEGYTPDQATISPINMNANSDNIDMTVTYKANTQKLNVKFIDDTTGKTLETVNKSGLSDMSVNYNTKNDISKYEGQHYVLVSDDTKGQNLVFDHDDNTDQSYEVHFKHGTHTINGSVTKNEVVHYVYAGDQARSGKAHDDYNAEALTFTRDGYHDDVDNTDHWNAWTPASQQFKAVTSPVIQGYTPDQATISAVDVNANSDNVDRTVTYKADKQTINVKFIDDTTGQTLKTVTKTGLSDMDSGYNTKSNIDDYKNAHYVLVSDSTNGNKLVYDHDDNVDQNYEVHLVHGTKTVSDSKMVHETVKYQYEDGTAAKPDYNASPVEFNRTGVQDLVTTNITWNAWNPANSQFNQVVTPAVPGYTPDSSVINSVEVGPTSDDVVKIVTYHADDQTILVNYIDDESHATLKTDSLVGKTNADAKYNTKSAIDNYLGQHYILVSDDTNGNDLNFDHDSTKTQVYNVHFKHAHEKVSDSHDVHEVIKYQFNDGRIAHDDFVATPISFNRTGDHDLVSDNINWNAWEQSAEQFNVVTSPVISGYTPSRVQVDAIKVDPTTKDINEVVTYAPDSQNILVNYIDDTTGTTIKTDSLHGVSDSDADYSTKSSIAGLIKQHYVLVSDDTNGQDLKFDHDDDTTQTYNVHVKHQTENTSRNHVVHEVINYEYADGSKAADTYTADPITLTQAGIHDLVTGQDNWNGTWTKSDGFVAVDSPVITGFTPSIKTVEAIPVDENTQDVHQIVVYARNNQEAGIKYIDDATGKVLTIDNITGQYDLPIVFSHNVDDEVKGFENQGYNLVSNNFDNQKYNADNSKNQFEVHFSHQTQNVKRDDTVSQTIHYVYEDGTKAEDDNAQTLNFEQHGVQDMVTHDIIWTPSDSQSFTAVTTPTITGYTPDVDQVDGHNVNFGDKDNVITVTYGANAQNAGIKFIDDTTNKTLSTEKADGKFNQVISFEHDPQALIVELQNRGYKLVSNNFSNQKYDSDNIKNQFEVHLVHGTKNVTRTDKVNRTIKYVYTNGQTAQPEVDQVVNFTEDGIQDLVTNDIDWTPAKSQTMDGVTTPELTGYTADKDQVASQIVNFGDGDQVITVTYSANAQQAGIKFIDDTDSKTLDHENANGKFDDEIKFNRDVNDEISQFEGQGYKLVSTNFNNNKYQSDNANNQFEVHFIHGTKNVSRDHNVIQTIHYVLADGTKAFDDNVQTLKFTQPGVQDLVTGKIEWTSIPSQTFTQVASPFKDGYTPDQKVILANTANFDSNDSGISVTYTVNDQAAGIKYIDDTTGNTLDTRQASGKFGDVIKFSRDVNDEISQFESQNYKLVSNNFDNQKYVSDNTKNQFEVHFVHATKNVTRTDKVNRTIHYVHSDGKTAEPDKVQVVNFTEDGVQDLVTGNITWTPAKSQTMASVDIPVLEGYTPDVRSVASQTVNFGDKDLDTTVTYSADAQQLDVAFIDDTTGKALQTVAKKGHSDEQAGYNTKNDINKYLGEHYKLVSDSTNGNDVVFDHDDKADQHYEVHFVHATKNVTRTDKVNRTIHYVYSDGKTAEPDKVQVINFTEDGVQDLVTGNITWTPAKSQTMASVDTPQLEGYTPDIKSVASQTVNFGDKDLDTTVTYSADAQKLDVAFIDDTTGKTLQIVVKKGHSDEQAGYNTKNDINKYLGEHYKLVSDSTNGNDLVFDHDDKADQHYEVHLIHGTEPASRNDQVTETVKYQFENGNKAGNDNVQTVNFKQTGIRDLVTGQIAWNKVDSQSFGVVVTPVLDGYTPDIAKVDAKTVNFGDTDQVITVLYSANAQQAGIKYIDETTGKTLDTENANGKFGESIKFDRDVNNEISQFEGQGYKLVSNSFNSQNYQSDNTKNQFEVHFVHNTEPASQSDLISQIIHYVYSDGKTAKYDHVQTVKFTKTGIRDLVTGNITWNSVEPQNFNQVDTPEIPGYTPDKFNVPSQVAHFGDHDQNIVVTYKADGQKLNVVFVDDTTGKVLQTVTKDGYSDEQSGYNTKNDINNYLGKHYKLVSDSTNGQDLKFDHDDKSDQHYEVHFVHDTKNVTRTDKVSRTVHYVYSDGKMVQPDKVQVANFTEGGVQDLVTGNINWDSAKSQDFAKIDLSVLDGYTSDITSVPVEVINFGDKDQDVTVTYSANEQTALVKFIDDDTNKVLHTYIDHGVFGQIIDVKMGIDEKINTLVRDGYNLVSNGYHGQTYQSDNSKNVVEIHLNHQISDVTDNKKVTRTIHYVDGDGHILQPDAIQTTTFTRTGKYDHVTKTTTWGPWSEDQTFDSVKIPDIDGYTTSQKFVEKIDVTPETGDSVVNVVYTKNPENIPGQHDGNSTSTQTQPKIPGNGVTAESVEANTVSQPEAQPAPSAKQQANTLPQTGNEHSKVGLIGFAFAGLAGMLGFGKKRKHD